VREVEAGAAQESPKSEVAREAKDGASPAGRGRDLAEVRKAKRPRKRPVLAAVSDTGEPRSAAIPAKAARSEAEEASHPNRANVSRPAIVQSPAAERSGAGGSRKKRRELPPYLRVVK
jgi:hypothetical protein